MNQVPHIKRNFWNAALAEKPEPLDVANRALELQYEAEAKAEQEPEQQWPSPNAKREQYITADEARALVKSGGEAEYYASEYLSPTEGKWVNCAVLAYFDDKFNDGEIIKYRAIRKEVPAEPKPDTFKRENRYIVLKNKDVAQLNFHQRLALRDVQDTIDIIRSLRGKSALESVVVESDDPAYEAAWKLIEQGVQPEPAETIDHIKLLGEIYGFLQSICPMGIADEAFRIVPEPIRAQAIAPYAEPRDEIGERLRHSQEIGRAEVEPHAEREARLREAVNKVLEPTCQVKNLDTGEFRTMTREKAKKLQAELGDTVEWFFPNGLDFGNHFVAGFKSDGIYTYKLKANLVKLDGKLMTREAAIALWESKKDTHLMHFQIKDDSPWFPALVEGLPKDLDAYFSIDKTASFELRERPLKQISWKDVPVGVAVSFYGGLHTLVGASGEKALLADRGGLRVKQIDIAIATETKTYVITEAQILVLQHDGNPLTGSQKAVIKSLPVITGEPVAREKLLGAIGRAWCHQDNAHKVLDEAVSFAVCKEIEALNLYTNPQLRRPEDFDTWQKNPYTIVLQKSIDEDYQPKLQPITADMVTNEMIATYDDLAFSCTTDRQNIAAAVNAFIKHKGEAK